MVTCWLTFSSSMTANWVTLWSLIPDLEVLAADGCLRRGLSCSGVAGGSTPPPLGGADEATFSRPSVTTPDMLFRNGIGFWLASDVDLAEASISLSSFSGGCSRWEVALRRGAAQIETDIHSCTYVQLVVSDF